MITVFKKCAYNFDIGNYVSAGLRDALCSFTILLFLLTLVLAMCFFFFLCGCVHISTGVHGVQRHCVSPEATVTGSCESSNGVLVCKRRMCV